MRIGGRETAQDIALVAEIGNNHEGSTQRAIDLIETAFECGADAVKMQTFVPQLLVSALMPERVSQLARFALPQDDVRSIIRSFAEREKVVFSTPLDLTSLRVIADAPLLKVSSGDITFVQLLEACAATLKPIIVSTGDSDLDDVLRAVTIVKDVWRSHRHPGELALLHCVSAYPTPLWDANLAVLSTLAGEFPEAVIGYSDHVIGIEACELAAAAGARIIEKHFTLNKEYSDFRDHALSADPEDLALLRERLDTVNAALGSGAKHPMPSELPNREAIRRGVAAAKDLPSGSVLTESDLLIVRPAQGLAPDQAASCIGRTLVRDRAEGDPIRREDVNFT